MPLPALPDTTTTISLTFVFMDLFVGVTGLILILIFHGSPNEDLANMNQGNNDEGYVEVKKDPIILIAI